MQLVVVWDYFTAKPFLCLNKSIQFIFSEEYYLLAGFEYCNLQHCEVKIFLLNVSQSFLIM